MTQLTLNLVNNSSRPGNLVLFQRLGNSMTSLAWLSHYAYPGTTLTYQWDNTAWCFVWAGTGQIGPGVVVQAAQTIAANLASQNQISLSYHSQYQTFELHDLRQGQPSGNFIITQDTSIPVNGACVGIGMSGKPTFVVAAQPNMTVMITPQISYWLAFGDIQQGECLTDVDGLQAVQLTFPANVTTMTATYNEDGTWDIVSNILAKAEEEG